MGWDSSLAEGRKRMKKEFKRGEIRGIKCIKKFKFKLHQLLPLEMVEKNGPGFEEPLDLGLKKRSSLSPESKRTGIGAAGSAGSPEMLLTANNNPLLPKSSAGITGSGLPAANLAADLMPIKQSSGGNSKNNVSKDTGKQADQIGSQESDSFYKMYNKEIKVNQDEIPIILAELTDAAFNFIQRENYEKALILLQKTEGVLEVVSLEGCSRDRYVSFITYNNMSMCFQKLGMLDECIFYLKQSIALISDSKFYKNKKISVRNRRVNQECKLKLQLCAILSQNQNHSEALENARKSVVLSHQMFKDMEELCQIYIDKINYRDNLLAAQEQSDLEDAERVQLISMVLESSPAKEIPMNFLEQSISLVERSSLKMFPVVREVRRRLVNSEIAPKSDENQQDQQKQRKEDGGSGENSTEKGILDDEDDLEEEKPDMRSVLGFLNQNEWIYNLNIGNIMQIQPLSMKEFLQEVNDEIELSRDSFLGKLSILIVTYFCMSTEMRFLLQSRAQYLKPEVKKDRELESEFWHAKALEVACTFLPSECPLLNHVLLSYQKHHDPSMQPIKEDEENNDVLSVLRPLKGIDQSKYQPIIRTLPQVKIHLSPYKDHVPLKEVLRKINTEQVDSVINFNQTRVRKVAELTDKEVQVTLEVQQDRIRDNESSPTQANLSAIALPQKVNYDGLMDRNSASELIGVVDNSNILPLSLNDSRADANESAPISNNSQPTSTQKLKQQMYLQEDDQQMLENNSSMEGLEQQIMAAVESPSQQNTKMIDNRRRNNKDQVNGVDDEEFQFDSREDSFAVVEFQNDEDNENKMYDKIISKVLSNPRIDKRTLLKKFISKIEMESNVMNGGLASELSQIKKMMLSNEYDASEDQISAEKQLIPNQKHHAVSQIEKTQGQLLNDKNGQYEGAHSMQQINVINNLGDESSQSKLPVEMMHQQNQDEEGQLDDSEIMLNVPSETMAGQVGVQDARASRDHKRIQQQQIRPIRPQSSKMTTSQTREAQKSRIDTSTRTRSSSHHMKSAKQHAGIAQGSYQRKRELHGSRAHERKDFRKVKSYLEDESLFKDIERSTEYQDPLNLNVIEQSLQTDTAPVDTEELQQEQRSSQKSQSRSNSRKQRTRVNRHHSSIQSTDQAHQRHENQTSSNKKSHTFSRPSTAITNATRHSSVNLKRGRRRQNTPATASHPQKTLVAKELLDQQQEPSRPRSESSSRGRYQKYQTRYQQNRASEPKENVVAKENIVNFSQNAKNSGQQRLKHSAARKRLSVNHHQTNFMHGQSVEHQPASQTDSRALNKVSQKRLTGNKHHNLSVQQAAVPQGNQHHMTSKIKKLVSHKQIDTNAKRAQKFNKQKLSQTKNLLQQNNGKIQQQQPQSMNQASGIQRGRSTKQRRNHSNNSKSKSKSKSRSSGQRTYSGSSKRLKSRSNKARSSSENQGIQGNKELAQYSFDMIDGEQVVNINAASSVQQLLPHHHSKNDLQRQVLENQKTILSLLSRQRANSNDSRKSRSQNRKKSSFTAVANIQDLLPRKQNTQAKLISRLPMQQQDANNNSTNISHAQILLQAQSLPQQPTLKFGSHQTQQMLGGSQEIVDKQVIDGMQSNSSQHVQGLSNFIKQINTSKRLDNKSLQYLKKQQKNVSKGASQPSRSKAVAGAGLGGPQKKAAQMNNQQQHLLKQNLMKEIRHLQNRIQDDQQAHESSPNQQRSGGSNKSRGGGERSQSRSRSRSPSQPTKALIPKKKSFNYLMQHSKNMNFTTNEGSQLNESLLNMSSGKQMKVPSRAHATSKIEKRKIEKLITQNQGVDNNLAYNSFEESNQQAEKSAKKQLTAVGQTGNAHHSLSMFDSEVQLNKVNQFAPLHHQLSQNAILAPQTLSQNYILGQKRIGENQKQIANNSKMASKQVNKIQKRQSQNPGDKQRIMQSAAVNYRTNPHNMGTRQKLNKN